MGDISPDDESDEKDSMFLTVKNGMMQVIGVSNRMIGIGTLCSRDGNDPCRRSFLKYS